jgi:hypothetical protein
LNVQEENNLNYLPHFSKFLKENNGSCFANSAI